MKEVRLVLLRSGGFRTGVDKFGNVWEEFMCLPGFTTRCGICDELIDRGWQAEGVSVCGSHVSVARQKGSQEFSGVSEAEN